MIYGKGNSQKWRTAATTTSPIIIRTI